MKLEDLPDAAKVTVCTHVAKAERPVAYVAFKDWVIATCNKPDHTSDDFSREINVHKLRGMALPATVLALKAGEEARLSPNGNWLVEKVHDRWVREGLVRSRESNK